MAEMATGWEPDKRTHFDQIVADYDRARPDYPDEMFQDTFAYAKVAKAPRALEIGAGTGKATRPFLDAGFDVTAVELGTNMAEFLSEKFKGHSGFRVIVSAFEDAVLEEEGYDLVYAASSIHWVDAQIGCPKIFRLLKNGGTIALFRYNFFPCNGEALDGEIDAAYEKHFHRHFTEPKEKPIKKSHEELRQPDSILYRYGFNGLGAYGFADVTMNLYDAVKAYSADEYVAFLETLSDHRHLPQDDKAALYEAIKEAIRRHGGQYKMDYIFQLYMGRKP